MFAVNIDPFRDKLNGFNFAVNPYGTQREGLITKGQEFTTDWDNKWYSAVTRTADRYVVEMAIPFKILRYRRQEGTNTWLINFSRADITRNEIASWAPIPRNFTATALAFSFPNDDSFFWKTATSLARLGSPVSTRFFSGALGCPAIPARASTRKYRFWPGRG